jgi:hypothetical protein
MFYTIGIVVSTPYWKEVILDASYHGIGEEMS